MWKKIKYIIEEPIEQIRSENSKIILTMNSKRQQINKIILYLLPLTLMAFFLIIITIYGNGFVNGFKKLFSSDATKETYEFNTGLWIMSATVIGAVGLVVASVSAQSLTRNPLADASTLGTINSVVFLILISLSLGLFSFFARYTFALIGGFLSAGILIGVIFFSKKTMSKTKVILAGLAISIAFKTLSFFIWKQDRSLGEVFSAYTLGGAENIYTSTLNLKPWLTLLISSMLIFLGAGISLGNSHGMSIVELGDDKAAALGISAKRVKLLNALVLILTIPSAIVLVGNVAFVGLISIHGARLLLKSKNFNILLMVSILIGTIVSLFGLLMYLAIPSFTSSIWTTIIGSPLLIYLAWRRL